MWEIIDKIVQVAEAAIRDFGYLGIALGMALESACIPLPSEIILPFTGFLVWRGYLDLWGATLASALGCVAGSLAAYSVGYWGGRPFIFKYGRYMLISPETFRKVERWFQNYGEATIFISRLLPVIRTFISLPAGIGGMNLKKFVVYSFMGSLPWSFFFIYLGKKLGEHWDVLSPLFHRLDLGIVLVIIIFSFFFLLFKKQRKK